MGYPHPAIDDLLLDSVNHARHRYVIAQLGARRGTYLIKSSRLLVKFKPSLDSTLIGVEASPSGYFDLIRSMERNGLNVRSNIFQNIAISDTIASVKFLENGVSSHIIKATNDIPTISHSVQDHNKKRKFLISLPLIFERLSHLKMPKDSTLYSKSLSQRFPKDSNENVVEVKSTTIEEVLKDVSHVDFLEMDIQGAEYRSIPCASEILSEKVRMICIRTHGARADEETLQNVFMNLRWQRVLVWYNQMPVVIKEKEVPLTDGIHCWVNTNLREPCSLNFSQF